MTGAWARGQIPTPFSWPPSPTAMMATVSGTNCWCGAVNCFVFVFPSFLNVITTTLCQVVLLQIVSGWFYQLNEQTSGMILKVPLTAVDQQMHHGETPNTPNVRLLCSLSVQCVLHNIWGIFGHLRFAAACECLRQCYKNVLSIHPPSSAMPLKRKKKKITFVFLPVKQDTDHYVNAKQKPYRLSVDCASK